MDPAGFTWREIDMMAKGHEEHEWWHTATLMATVINMLSAKGKTVTPEELHPMVHKEEKKQFITKENFSDLKGIFGL